MRVQIWYRRGLAQVVIVSLAPVGRSLARLRRASAAIVLVAGAIAAVPTPALAATNTFNDNFDNNWNQSLNWSLGEVPDDTDDVVIPSGESAFIGVPDGVANSLTLDGTLVLNGATLTLGTGSSSITNTLTVRDGATLNLGTSTTLNASATTNALNVQNGSTLNLGTTVTWSSGRVQFAGVANAANIGGGEVLNITGNV